ncbi:MAG TPA: serine protease, partial [Planctomycetota bacterium]|nr:serine protease [Planctomycetota bacterium]
IARVVAICHDSDLALLEVEGPDFMEDVEPAEIGDLPELQDRVSVLGYPVGGEELSVTEGVVSRMEVQTYSHSQRRLLAGTVDAAINDGNSGGPVVKDGKVVGIAFQSLDDAENIGEMVPTPVIEHFLGCVAAGRAPILPAIGVGWQGMQNPELRRAHNLKAGQAGVLVTSVAYGSTGYGLVQVGDVLHSIGGHPIANNGTVQYRNRFRVAWYGLLCEYQVGDPMELEWSRAGVVQRSQVPLQPPTHLVQPHNYDRKPTYFVYGGIVFQPLTLEYLREWNNWWEKAPRELVQIYYRGVRSEACQEVVVLSMVLGDRVNVGYDGISDERVVSVGGVAPRDMAHFVQLVESTQGLLTLKTSSGLSIVLDTELAREAGPRILGRYRVPRDRSEDLARR